MKRKDKPKEIYMKFFYAMSRKMDVKTNTELHDVVSRRMRKKDYEKVTEELHATGNTTDRIRYAVVMRMRMELERDWLAR